MIYILEDLLTPSYHESIYNLAKNHLSYQYTYDTSWEHSEQPKYLKPDRKVIDIGQLTCCVFDADLGSKIQYGWAYEQLKPIFYTVKDRIPELGILGSNRVKFNILLQNNFGDHYNQPHVDIEYPSYAMVYYLNDCDGDTIVYNEKYNPCYSKNSHAYFDDFLNKKVTDILLIFIKLKFQHY